MTKEEILEKHIGAPIPLVGEERATRTIELAMDEYAKQQAIAFDIWKIKNHWVWSSSNLRYFKWENNNKHETVLSHEEIYTRFIEQQNKEQ